MASPTGQKGEYLDNEEIKRYISYVYELYDISDPLKASFISNKDSAKTEKKRVALKRESDPMNAKTIRA